MENYHIIIDKKMLKQTNGKRSTGPARDGEKKKKVKLSCLKQCGTGI